MTTWQRDLENRMLAVSTGLGTLFGTRVALGTKTKATLIAHDSPMCFVVRMTFVGTDMTTAERLGTWFKATTFKCSVNGRREGVVSFLPSGA
jgi:hypothetical protein